MTKDGYEMMEGRLALADENRSWKLTDISTSSLPDFKLENFVQLAYRNKSWISVERLGGDPFDFSDKGIVIAALLEGKPCRIHLSVGNGTEVAPFRTCADLWMSLEPGLNVIKTWVHDFVASRGQPLYSEINQLSFGGVAEDCVIRAWITDSEGRTIFEKDRSHFSKSVAITRKDTAKNDIAPHGPAAFLYRARVGLWELYLILLASISIAREEGVRSLLRKTKEKFASESFACLDRGRSIYVLTMNSTPNEHVIC